MSPEKRFWLFVAKSDGCWDWTGARTKAGYGRISRNGHETYAHRFSFEMEHGVTLAPDQKICHHCDNPRCVRPSHLFLGKDIDNIRDCIAKGRFKFIVQRVGEDHPGAKLTAADVMAIRDSTLGTVAASKRFGVAKTTIKRIRNGSSWKHLLQTPISIE
jgi:hypothetical protein